MSYGFEFRDAAGVPRLKITEALSRVVFSQRFAASFTGTVSIPSFDSDQGGFFIKPCAIKCQKATPSTSSPPYYRALDSTPLNTTVKEFGLQSAAHPVLSWDNSSKVMTISNGPAVTQTNIFGSFNDPFAIPDYYLICVHGNLVF